MTHFERNQSSQALILDDTVRKIVQDIETTGAFRNPIDLNSLLQKLIVTLRTNCEKPDVKARYQQYAQSVGLGLATMKETGPYPLDQEGYAIGFDPVEDENSFWNAWTRYGFVISKSVVSKGLCQTTTQRVREIVQTLSQGKFSLDEPSSHFQMPQDIEGTSFISRGFFEFYHDDSLAQLRQAIRVYLHHVVIWGQADLWTSFDRFGVKLVGHIESQGLPLHVDQNPLVHPSFETIQGVLALTDCPIERGTYVAVPGSKHIFQEYTSIIEARKPDYRGEYIELPTDLQIAETLYGYSQAIPIRAGDLISWDSRTTHANSANVSGEARIVAYIAASPAREHNENLLAVRKEAFETGLGSNVRDAYLHASMRPRFTDQAAVSKIRHPEQLSKLGELLYGHEKYETLY
jgi:hypothetical protein